MVGDVQALLQMSVAGARARRCAVVVLIGLSSLPASAAALPEGFPVNGANRSETVIYIRTSHELRSTVHRPTIEAVCRATPGGPTPVFEPGFDEPIRTLTHQYISPTGDRRASYAHIDFYGCEGAELKARGMCACTYRKQSERKIDLQLQGKDGRETWTAWLDRGNGTHEFRAGPGRAGAAAVPVDLQDSLLGAAVELQTVAGLTCTLRRKSEATRRSESCRTLADAALPEPLRAHMLSSAAWTIERGELVPYSRLSTEFLNVATPVDAGVFSPPAGIDYQQRGVR